MSVNRWIAMGMLCKSSWSILGVDCCVLVPKVCMDGDAPAACVCPNPKPVLGVLVAACCPKLKPPPVAAAACDWPKPKLMLGVPNAGADCGVAICPKRGAAAAWL